MSLRSVRSAPSNSTHSTTSAYLQSLPPPFPNEYEDEDTIERPGTSSDSVVPGLYFDKSERFWRYEDILGEMKTHFLTEHKNRSQRKKELYIEFITKYRTDKQMIYKFVLKYMIDA